MLIDMKQRKSLLDRELEGSIWIVFFPTLSRVDKIKGWWRISEMRTQGDGNGQWEKIDRGPFTGLRKYFYKLRF